MAGLADNRGEERTVAIDATYPKAHRTATGLGVESSEDQPLIQWINGPTDGRGRPVDPRAA